MRRVYIAHKLTGDWPAYNVERYLRHCADALQEGDTVLSWVVNYLTHTRGLTAGDHAFYMEIDRALIGVCDEVRVCGSDWKTSVGVQLEIAYAREIGKPVLYRQYDHFLFGPAEGAERVPVREDREWSVISYCTSCEYGNRLGVHGPWDGYNCRAPDLQAAVVWVADHTRNGWVCAGSPGCPVRAPSAPDGM